MVKLDYNRDYYADLELPPTADAAEVKKQFKKLALKWHPDRNPGKEDEAKEKFLVIQSAHEILTDPISKTKFDAHRQRTARYSFASGVRGNPWQSTSQEVNQKFGVPPTRPPMPTRPAAQPAASSRYWDWAPKARPKTDSAKANTKTDNAKANISEAWDRSRPQPKPSQPAAANRPRPREPPTPRTASQARRQEAAFGTRKTGFAPASPMGDEPPVRNQHYNTSAKTAFGESAPQASKARPASTYVDPLSAQFSEIFGDARQRTPYAANIGEKTDPFEGLNVDRAKSMRDGSRRPEDSAGGNRPPPPPRQRSASVGSDTFKRSTGEKPSFDEASWFDPAFPSPSRASARYSPRGAETNSAPPTAAFPEASTSTSSVSSSTNATVNSGTSAQAKNGTKVYESFAFSSTYRNIYSSAQTQQWTSQVGAGPTRGNEFGFPANMSEGGVSSNPSGERAPLGANLFDAMLHAQLQHLLAKAGRQSYSQHAPSASNNAVPPGLGSHGPNRNTNTAHHDSFSVPVDDEPAFPTQKARFTRNSADNINTRFVADKNAAGFRFSAGAATAEDGFLRAKHQARGRQSPLRNEFTSQAETADGGPRERATGKKQGEFDPQQWEEAFGPYTFGLHIPMPPQANRPSGSPARPVRPIKKPRPVRMTAGTAGMVDDEETTSGEDRPKPDATPSGISGTRSPNAMDIDTPPPEPAAAPATGARNINVEPTKPEWRAGDVNSVKPEPKLGAGLNKANLKPTAAGSEDSDEFARPIFSEFRNVEPFAQKMAGLSSFADLTSKLPFPSRPAAKIALAHEKARPPEMPSPPAAPRPPAGLVVPGTKLGAPAWMMYVREFEAYLALWLDYNKKVTDHFAARQRLHEKRGLAWLNAQGDDASGGVDEYLRAQEEDKYVRQRWMAACETHELHFREFVECRRRVMRQ